MIARIWSTTSQLEAECISSLLRASDIGVRVESSHAFYAIGFPTSVTPFVVTVSEADAPRSWKLIAPYWQRMTGNQIAAPDPDETPDECHDLFGIDEAEEARFRDSVVRAKRTSRLMWWVVILVYLNTSWVILLFLPWLLRKPRARTEPEAAPTA